MHSTHKCTWNNTLRTIEDKEREENLLSVINMFRCSHVHFQKGYGIKHEWGVHSLFHFLRRGPWFIKREEPRVYQWSDSVWNRFLWCSMTNVSWFTQSISQAVSNDWLGVEMCLSPNLPPWFLARLGLSKEKEHKLIIVLNNSVLLTGSWDYLELSESTWKTMQFS